MAGRMYMLVPENYCTDFILMILLQFRFRYELYLNIIWTMKRRIYFGLFDMLIHRWD
jgi:hypothetical protein